ncbi:ribonuclease H-like domain-containing protein [Tanacetum coccineum]
MSTYLMVTRAKAGICKPLERMNCHVTTTLPLLRSHVHALCDSHWKEAMYKARLVANGHSQHQVSHDWPIHQLDVKNAFLHGHLSETVYMHQSPGFVDPNKPSYLCHLQRSLYGLKQAPLAWFKRFATSSSAFLQRIIASLNTKFAMMDLGSLNNFLESKLGSDGDPVSNPTLYRSLAGALYYLTFTRRTYLMLFTRSISHLLLSLLRILMLIGLAALLPVDPHLGVANIVAETAWILNLLCELHTPLFNATLVYYDNVSVVYMSANPVQHQRTKHIEIDIHFVRDFVASGQVKDEEVKDDEKDNEEENDDDDGSIDIANTDDERTESDNDDHEESDTAQTEEQEDEDEADKAYEEESKKVKEEKTSEEQRQYDQAEVDKVPSIAKDYLGISLEDSLKKVLQSHTKELKQELTVKKMKYADFIKESVQANIRNKLKNQLPKEVLEFATPVIQEALAKTPLSKRDCDDDKDEDPSAGTNQGKETKKRKTGKEAEPSKKSSKSKESTKGKPPSKSTKTEKSSFADQSVQEPELDVKMDVETFVNETNDDDVPQVDPKPRTPKLQWFTQPLIPETPSPDYTPSRRLMMLKNGHGGKAERTYSSSITKTPAARYTMKGIEDLIPNLWSVVLIAYDMDAVLGIKHWRPQRQLFYRAMINKMSKHVILSKMRILSVVIIEVEKKCGYGHLKEIVIRRADQKLYKFKKGNFPNLYLIDIEDMLPLLIQNRLFNLEGDVVVNLGVALRMFTRDIVLQSRVKYVQLGVESYQRKLNLSRPQRSCPGISAKELYTPNYDPQGVIYEDKKQQKRFMQVDELHKFYDLDIMPRCSQDSSS